MANQMSSFLCGLHNQAAFISVCHLSECHFKRELAFRNHAFLTNQLIRGLTLVGNRFLTYSLGKAISYIHLDLNSNPPLCY